MARFICFALEGEFGRRLCKYSPLLLPKHSGSPWRVRSDDQLWLRARPSLSPLSFLLRQTLYVGRAQPALSPETNGGHLLAHGGGTSAIPAIQGLLLLRRCSGNSLEPFQVHLPAAAAEGGEGLCGVLRPVLVYVLCSAAATCFRAFFCLRPRYRKQGAKVAASPALSTLCTAVLTTT